MLLFLKKSWCSLSNWISRYTTIQISNQTILWFYSQFCAAKYWLRISMSTDGSLLLVEKLESIQTQIYVVGPWSLCRQCSVHWQHQIHQAVDFVSFQWHRMGSSVINKLKLTKENNSGWRMKNTQDPWPHNKSHGAHEHAAGNQKLFWKRLN